MTDETTPQHDGDESSWLSELSDAALSPSGPQKPSEPVVELPPIERTRPIRPALVPQWAWIAIASTVVAIALLIATIVTVSAMSRVAVPDVTGVAVGVARTRLAQVGLEVEITERRFSTLPPDQVLEQEPGAGAQAQRGDTVRLVVSGGSEEFAMPDVIGNGLALARGTLETRGLVVVVEPVISDAASDTVLSSTPAAGAIVRTGDAVRLQVAAPRVPGVTLQPYSLQGVIVTIDPAGPVVGAPDASIDVARRLQSLLEASGASVTMLRSGVATGTSEGARLRAAQQAPRATVAIGFDVIKAGAAGRIVSAPSTGTVGAIPATDKLASVLTSELAMAAPPVSTTPTSTDLVLPATGGQWARITLGSAGARQDLNSFEDPAWADSVARAVYTALGKVYGVLQQP